MVPTGSTRPRSDFILTPAMDKSFGELHNTLATDSQREELYKSTHNKIKFRAYLQQMISHGSAEQSMHAADVLRGLNQQ